MMDDFHFSFMDSIFFKFVTVKFKSNGKIKNLQLPCLMFPESLREKSELDFTEYNETIVGYFIEYLYKKHNMVHGDIPRIKNISFLMNLLDICFEKKLIDLYKLIYYEYESFIWSKENISTALANLKFDLIKFPNRSENIRKIKIKDITSDKIFKFLFDDQFYHILNYFSHLSKCDRTKFIQKFFNYSSNNNEIEFCALNLSCADDLFIFSKKFTIKLNGDDVLVGLYNIFIGIENETGEDYDYDDRISFKSNLPERSILVKEITDKDLESLTSNMWYFWKNGYLLVT